jgi:hypothetical protein
VNTLTRVLFVRALPPPHRGSNRCHADGLPAIVCFPALSSRCHDHIIISSSRRSWGCNTTSKKHNDTTDEQYWDDIWASAPARAELFDFDCEFPHRSNRVISFATSYDTVHPTSAKRVGLDCFSDVMDRFFCGAQ